MVADVAESLDDDPLPLEAASQPDRLHVLGEVAGLTNTDHDPPAGRFDPPANPSLRQRFPGDAAQVR